MTKKLNTLTDLKNLGLSSPKRNLLITKDSQSANLLHEELKDEFQCLFLEGSELLPYDFFSSSPGRQDGVVPAGHTSDNMHADADAAGKSRWSSNFTSHSSLFHFT